VTATVGTGIGRVVNAVGTSSRCWILAAATSTLDSTIAAGFRTMDAANAVGTSSRRVRSGMICIFSNYRVRIKNFVNIMQV
jgi:uncharacterized membrane protein YbhN (UPF0104 family)